MSQAKVATNCMLACKVIRALFCSCVKYLKLRKERTLLRHLSSVDGQQSMPILFLSFCRDLEQRPQVDTAVLRGILRIIGSRIARAQV
jgi:hypothetical protein